MLKNRNNFPPGGYTFHQPETGWDAPGWMSFDATVNAIIKHRLANPRHNLAIAFNVVEWELEKFTEERLKSIPGGLAYLVQNTQIAQALSFPVPHSPRPAAVVGAVKKLKAGIGLLIDWLGADVEPVKQELANARAGICKDCKSNSSKHISTYFTEPASARIQEQLEIKHDMVLSTEHDDKLGTCEICLCPMKLKIWTPTGFIKEHTPDEVVQNLPDHCWVKQELSL